MTNICTFKTKLKQPVTVELFELKLTCLTSLFCPVILPLHISNSFPDFPELQRANREWQDAI